MIFEIVFLYKNWLENSLFNPILRSEALVVSKILRLCFQDILFDVGRLVINVSLAMTMLPHKFIVEVQVTSKLLCGWRKGGCWGISWSEPASREQNGNKERERDVKQRTVWF